jgi:inhibitor of KinA sporulation pathway (predicted exonuclease)
VGLAFAGQAHDALHDARAIAGAMAVMATRGAHLRPAA